VEAVVPLVCDVEVELFAIGTRLTVCSIAILVFARRLGFLLLSFLPAFDTLWVTKAIMFGGLLFFSYHFTNFANSWLHSAAATV
jgi:hypothetical protein